LNPLADAFIGFGAGTGLVFSRLGGFVVTSPFPGGRVGSTARMALVFALSAIAVPLIPPGFSGRALDRTLAPIAITEVMIGLLLGFVLRVLVSAGDTMGELVGQATGLNGAALFDPGAEGHETAIGRLITVLAAWILLASGAHRVAISVLLESFRAVPLGVGITPGNATQPLVTLIGKTLVAGTQMGLPLMAISLCVQLALAMIARAAPSLQIFNVGFSLLIAGGFLVLLDVLPDVVRSMTQHFSTTPAALREVFDGVVPR
jgi:flagellar biosynthetic protein FliR